MTSAVLPRSDGRTYTDVLPAINLAFLLPSEQAIRVGIAREIARARMDQLKASSEVGYDQATGRPGCPGTAHGSQRRSTRIPMAAFEAARAIAC